jgi:hypothetical protein
MNKKISEHIDYLCCVDWYKEEFKPYDINEKMTTAELKEHLHNYIYEISLDLNIKVTE